MTFTGRIKTALYRVAVPVAVRRLHAAARAAASVEALVDLTFRFRCLGLSLKPAQVRSEILALAQLVAQRRPATVLEIGTARGGTLFLFSQLAAKSARLVSVDLPEGPFGGGYPERRNPFYEGFKGPAQSLTLVRADSHSPDTLARVRGLLGGQPVDFLFIDGDHSLAGVRQDFEMYSPLLRPGGLLAFHDIVPGRPELVGGVPDFWQEIKGRYQTQELVADWRQGGYGIGVVTL